MSANELRDYEEWAALYGLYAARPADGGRHLSFQSVADAYGSDCELDRQKVHYRVRTLEKQARRMAYIAARSAALRAFLFRELLSYADESWFETYAGFPLDTPDAVVEQVVREVRSAYP